MKKITYIVACSTIITLCLPVTTAQAKPPLWEVVRSLCPAPLTEENRKTVLLAAAATATTYVGCTATSYLWNRFSPWSEANKTKENFQALFALCTTTFTACLANEFELEKEKLHLQSTLQKQEIALAELNKNQLDAKLEFNKELLTIAKLTRESLDKRPKNAEMLQMFQIFEKNLKNSKTIENIWAELYRLEQKTDPDYRTTKVNE